MKKKQLCPCFGYRKGLKKWLIMKLCVFLICVFSFSLVANTHAQQERITLDLKNVSLKSLFNEIQKQTELSFVFNTELTKDMSNLSVQVENEMVVNVLERVLKGTGLTYKFEQDIIFITESSRKQDLEAKEVKIRGRVVDEDNNPLPGVTVRIKGLSMGTSTDNNGEFAFSTPKLDGVTLVFSFIGKKTKELKWKDEDKVVVILTDDVSEMNEVVITGYQVIEKRHLTSAVTTLKADDINVAGINTVDKMLEGYVPGLVFMQNSGQVGAAPRLRIRGSSTVLGTREPLWVVDGIIQHDPVNVDPSLINDLDFVNLLGNAISGLNPDDIEQIDVLKDASATAIYGVRAANGVIVITTKKGKPGPPTISYALSGTFNQRPRYSDRDVNMMNSKERVDLSRDIVQQGINFPIMDAWIGYEAAVYDFYAGNISFQEFQALVEKYETVNTDWFKLLTNDTFSHNHTLSVSGGSDVARYYGSLGFNDERGVLKGEKNKRYSTNLNFTARYNKFSVQMGLQASMNEKRYTPSEVGLLNYAYNTSRTIPAYDDNGEYWFYDRYNSDAGKIKTFNVLNEREHSSNRIDMNSFTFTTNVKYDIFDYLKLGATLSYSTSNSYQETYFGEKTFYAEGLRAYQAEGTIDNLLPYGGELKEDNTRNNSYTVRLQLDFNKFIDKNNIHLISSSLGGELSSTRYLGNKKTYRAYMPERGKTVSPVDRSAYPQYAEWLLTDPEALGIRKDQLTNITSAYISLSYSYKDFYVLNFNTRTDASNKFGSKSNKKLLPIWSISGRWNVKESALARANWIDLLALRMSFGYQGNMLDTQSPELIIKKGGMNTTYQKYESTISSFPNPYLKWEKTSSFNAGLDFALFNNKVSGTISYYYKKTKDAFLNKTVSEINGITSYVVNSGTLENQGYELSFNFIPFNPTVGGEGFRWSIDPQLGQVLNKLLQKATNSKDKILRDVVRYTDYLSGNVEVKGKPLDTFFSYRFAGLDPTDGRPMFDNTDLDEMKEIYNDMEKEDVFLTVMKSSGSRVPYLQGGINNRMSYKRFILAFNLTYSFGSKVRLLSLYPNVKNDYKTLAPLPQFNVSRDFLKRWRKPGDEDHTSIPGFISSDDFTKTMTSVWWHSYPYNFASNIWQMYDNSDVRVVKADYLRLQTMSLKYLLPDNFCKKLHLKSASVEFSGTNLFTICNKKLKGQDPATQSGSSDNINLSLRPTYSCRLNITF